MSGPHLRVPGNHAVVRRYPDSMNYEDHTTVYTAGHAMNGEIDTHHADLSCPRLRNSWAWRNGHVRAVTLPYILGSWVSARNPCSYCTVDSETEARVAVEHDGVSPDELRISDDLRRELDDERPDEPIATLTSEQTNEGGRE